ncbi:hypothetical protein DDO07_06230 [Vibrio cholerae]|nr:hypothetical protein [Vibrio cholerae]EGR4171665.1 hypothetical protein [Vibrio cholerae]
MATLVQCSCFTPKEIACDLPLQVVWVKMRFKMALRYLTDTQQETTCCLNHFQKFFDNPT